VPPESEPAAAAERPDAPTAGSRNAAASPAPLGASPDPASPSRPPLPLQAAAPASPVAVAAFYRFVRFDADALPGLRRRLLAIGEAEGVRGTVLLAPEGVNGTVSASPQGVEALLAALRSEPRLQDLEVKWAAAPQQAFHRLKVRIKREIVTMGEPLADPQRSVGRYVSPDDWNRLIDDPDTLVIDTRNAYEVGIGSFAGAIQPHTRCFRQFPDWVRQELPALVAQRRPKALALFCTGGIRCEKATALLMAEGYTGVHHLQGGILRYLEQVPEESSRWRGECFVFDQRVAVNHRLEPGEHSLCHACGLPLAPADRALASYVEGVSCCHCLDRFSDADRARFAERQRQIERAAARGDAHIGAVPPAAPR